MNQQDQTVREGDRVALVDLDVVRLGTIDVVEADGNAVRIRWDDGFEDTGPEGLWPWPQRDLKRVV